MKVIAKKKRGNSSNANLGYVQPILKFDEESLKYKEVNIQIEFPNVGEIFITREYNLIENDFEDGELFVIEEVKLNDTNYVEERAGNCMYTAVSSNVTRLKKWEYIPVFETEFNLEGRSAQNLPSYKNVSPFFIKDALYLYGPFTYDIVTLSALTVDYFDTDSLLDDNIIESTFSEARDFIFKYELISVSDIFVANYISDLQLLFKRKPAENIYFGTKEKIIEWGKRNFLTKLNENERSLLAKLNEIEVPKFNSNFEQQKIDLFKKYLVETNTWLNIELPKHFKEFLESKSGLSHLNKYLDDNKELFFNQYRKSEIFEIENSIVLKREELNNLSNDIIGFEIKNSTHDDKLFDGINDGEIIKLKSIISSVELRDLLLRYYDDNINLEIAKDEFKRLESRKEYLEEQIVKQDKRLNTVTKAIKSVKGEIFDDQEFAKKVIDAKIYTDLLNNIDPSQDESINLEAYQIKEKFINKTQFNNKQFIEEIRSRLELYSRKIEFNDVINYLVLLNHNFITILAGLPGVGKTSLVEKLSSVLGCYENKRYLKIPVGRGWTSSKDLIGYYNPLTKKYQGSKTDLYRFLKVCEEDKKIGIEVPSIILLDEANLSSIEHYWSEFLSLSDFDYERSLKTTDKEVIYFGSGVRFLATINYDHTTETLSDRLISRAPVVIMKVADYMIEESQDIIFPEIFSMVQLNSFLSKGVARDYFKGDVKNKFDSIIKTLQDDDVSYGQAIIIGMRKYKSVEKYCSVAGNIMEDSNKFIALDYAINQYILPLINGRGDNYVKRLQELKEKLQGLPQSLNTVSRIIQVGNDNFKTYKFFS